MTDLRGRLEAALGSAYRVEQELGGGGMSRVFLAEDSALGRKVVVKVLPPEMAAGVNIERFRREIQLSASLQHPHIVPLHAAGQAGDLFYYTMPLVEGESLRVKLAREGELPVPDVARILRDVADGLAYAHQHGVVHRDIKPDNILISGHHAVVTDFGVAKAVSEATGASSLTSIGVALGTPAYMAPEQAAADPHADYRVDIYALGALGYEMLTGRPPFTGSSPQMVLAAQVNQAPEPVTRHRPSVPPALAELVMRCLEKKPADRWQSADELLHTLESVATPSGGVTPTRAEPVAAVTRRLRPRQLAIGLASLVVVAGAVALVVGRGARRPTIAFGQTRQVTLEFNLELDPALSPDGRMLAYAAGPPGNMRIYVRTTAEGSPVLVSKGLAGDHRMPRWSPDGTQILFSAAGGIHTVPALGGSLRTVAGATPDVVRAYGTWSPDGREIAYVQAGASGAIGPTTIYRQSLDAGAQRKVVEGFDVHSLAWSPDGRFIAYVSGNSAYVYGGTNLGNLGPSAVLVVAASGGTPVDLTGRRFLNMSPTWSPDSRSLLIVSTRDGRRDVHWIPIRRNGALAGPIERLTTGLNAGTINLSAGGALLGYSEFTNPGNIWAIRIPPAAPVSVREAVPITSGTQHIEGLSVSPDGRWLAFDSDRGGFAHIYKMPMEGGEPVQLTSGPHYDFIPAWSRDGRWLAFQSWRSGNRDIFVVGADGGAAEEQVTNNPAQDMYPDWAPDGRRLAFYSNRTGRVEIYVAQRAASGGWDEARQLTTDGGFVPKHSPDGRTILYLGNGVQTIGVDGRPARSLLPVPFEQGGMKYSARAAEWSRDGRTVYIKATDTLLVPSFWAVSASGGSPRLLVRFDDPSRPSGRQEFATDGKRLYFTVDSRTSHIWLMDARKGDAAGAP